MADVPWDEDVTTDDTTPVGEWNAFKDRIISIAGDKSVEDGFLRLKQGSLEDRPAAEMEGRLYYSTDEGVWYRDNGEEWKELVRCEGEIRLAELGEKSYSSLSDIPSEFTPEGHGDGAHNENYEKQDNKGSALGYAGLDSEGEVYSEQLPAVAKHRVYIVQDLTERDSISDQNHGDKCFVLDTGETYIWDEDSGTDGEWLLQAESDFEDIEVYWGNVLNRTHDIAGSDHGQSELSELNGKISDADLSGDPVGDVESAGLSMEANINPKSDNSRKLGGSSQRWSEIHAVDVYGTVHYDDLAFTEKKCEVCGEKFEVGEKVSLIVNEVKEDGTYLVPKHEGC